MRSALDSRPNYNAPGLLGRVGAILERLFIVSSLTVFTGAFAPLFGVTSEANDGNPTMQVVYLGVYLVSAGIMLLNLRSLGRALQASRWILVLVLLATLSVEWSAAPSLTLRRAIALGGTTLFGIYLALRHDTREQLNLVAWASGVGVVASLLVSTVVPIHGLGAHVHGTDWRGVFIHKNSLGRAMSFSALVFMMLRSERARYSVSVIALMAMALFLLMMSGSVTAIVVFFVLVLALPAFRVLRFRSNLQLASLLLVTIALGFVGDTMWTHAGELANALGRNLTISGRTQLWQLVLEEVSRRPWLGYGYSGFWLGWVGPSAHVWAQTGWMPPDAHNGWLDLLLALGIVGTTLFGYLLILGLWHSVRYFKSHDSRLGQWPLMYFVFLLLTNLTESSFLVRNDIFWVLQVAIIVRLGMSQNGVAK